MKHIRQFVSSKLSQWLNDYRESYIAVSSFAWAQLKGGSITFAPTMRATDDGLGVLFKHQADVMHQDYWEYMLAHQVLNKRGHYASPTAKSSLMEVINDLLEDDLSVVSVPPLEVKGSATTSGASIDSANIFGSNNDWKLDNDEHINFFQHVEHKEVEETSSHHEDDNNDNQYEAEVGIGEG